MYAKWFAECDAQARARYDVEASDLRYDWRGAFVAGHSPVEAVTEAMAEAEERRDAENEADMAAFLRSTAPGLLWGVADEAAIAAAREPMISAAFARRNRGGDVMASDTNEQPEFVTDDHLEYLDDLRDSGVVNMLGAAPYVAKEFGISIECARKVLSYWRRTYGERHPD